MSPATTDPRAWWRRPASRAAGVVLALLTLADALLVALEWPLLVFVAVALLAVSALRPGARSEVLTLATVVVSWAGTVAMALAAPRWAASFGLVETAALLLLLVARWRVAAGPRRWLLVAGVVVAVVGLPVRVLEPETPSLVVAMVAAVALAIAVAVALRAQDVQRRLAVADVRRTERELVARELHDVVAHHVTGMVVATQAVRATAGTGSVPPEVLGALASIETAGAEALGAMRRLVAVLRADPDGTAPHAPTPRLTDLPELVDRFRSSGASGAVKLAPPATGEPLPPGAGAVRGLPADVEAGLYRVVQESLTNVARHAPGCALTRVVVNRSADAVSVTVANTPGTRSTDEDGPPAGGGFGIIGMRERIAALGGTLDVGPPRDGTAGWAVQATVPIDGATTDDGRTA